MYKLDFSLAAISVSARRTKEEKCYIFSLRVVNVKLIIQCKQDLWFCTKTVLKIQTYLLLNYSSKSLEPALQLLNRERKTQPIVYTLWKQ